MKRLLEGDGGDFERGLLDALRLERPSADLEQRMREAIGLVPVPAPAPAAPLAPAAPAAKVFGTWGAIATGSIVAAVLVGGGTLMNTEDDAPIVDPAPKAPVEVVVPNEPAPVPLSEFPAEAKATEQPNAARSRAMSSAPNASLKEEIRLIDSARVAVKKNDGARAMGILDQYARRFPRGAFAEEARVLRAEALKIEPNKNY